MQPLSLPLLRQSAYTRRVPDRVMPPAASFLPLSQAGAPTRSEPAPLAPSEGLSWVPSLVSFYEVRGCFVSLCS